MKQKETELKNKKDLEANSKPTAAWKLKKFQ